MAIDFLRGFGAVGKAERAKLAAPGLQNERIKAFIESSGFQDRINAVRAEALERGELDPTRLRTSRSAGGTTPSEQIGKLSETITRLGNLTSPEAAEAVAFLSGKMTDLVARDKAATREARSPAAVEAARTPRGFKGGMTDRIAADLAKPPPKDRRSLFSGADVTFDSVGPPTGISPPQAVADANSLTNVSAALKPAGANLFQAPTPDFPESNVPPSFSEIGLTAKDDIAEFSKLEKGLPGVDLRSQYQANSGGFAKILAALKAGKTPDGKPFTIKDAIKFIQANQ